MTQRPINKPHGLFKVDFLLSTMGQCFWRLYVTLILGKALPLPRGCPGTF